MNAPAPRQPSKRPAFDPEAAPIVDRGDVHEAVATHWLTPANVRAAFARPQPWAHELTDESRMAAVRDPTPAAVLVPLVQRDEGLMVLLTRRTAHLHDHAGQISFPGGRVDADDTTRVTTALREAREEVGLHPAEIEVIGHLPDYLTGTGFVVTPVVALVSVPYTLAPDSFEVAEVFETPLAYLMNPAHHEVRAVRWFDEHTEFVRQFYAMPWQRHETRYFIWGATAAMLRNLYRFLHAQQ